MFAVQLDTVHVSKPVHMTVDCISYVFVLCIFYLCTNDESSLKYVFPLLGVQKELLEGVAPPDDS